MIRAWTVCYSYPDVPLEENFDHAEMGLSITSKDIQHKAIDLFKLNIQPKLRYNGESIESPNIIFLRALIIHDKLYQEMKSIENSGCVFLNDVDAHYHASNKIKMIKKLQKDNIKIPKTILLPIPFYDDMIEIIGDEIGWPCVTKWMHGYARLGVEICKTPEDLYRIAKKRDDISQQHRLPRSKFDTLIIQKMLRPGHVIQVHSIGNIHHAVLQIHPDDYTFKSNIAKGTINLPYEMDMEMTNTVEHALKSLNLDSARMDLMLDDDGYKICEINPQASQSTATMTYLKNISDIVVDHAYKKMLLR